MSPLNPAYLLTFSSAMELGSFTAAAERAGMTQPAVSHQIRELERRLQLRLVERVGRRVKPTQAGQLLLEHAARIKLALDDAEAAMQRHASTPGGLVRIGTGATACIHLLPPVLRQLKRRMPLLDIVVSTGNTPEILRRVEDNTLDAALVTMPATGRSLDIQPVVRDAFFAIAPRRQAAMRRIAPQALSRQPLVLFETGANTRRLVDDWFAQAGCRVKPVMELGSVEAIKEMVAAGLGWSVLPHLAVATARQRNGLEVIRLAPGLERTLAWVMRRDKPLNRALGAVREAVLGLQRAARVLG